MKHASKCTDGSLEQRTVSQLFVLSDAVVFSVRCRLDDGRSILCIPIGNFESALSLYGDDPFPTSSHRPTMPLNSGWRQAKCKSSIIRRTSSFMIPSCMLVGVDYDCFNPVFADGLISIASGDYDCFLFFDLKFFCRDRRISMVLNST